MPYVITFFFSNGENLFYTCNVPPDKYFMRRCLGHTSHKDTPITT